MKPPPIALEKITALPAVYRMIIPAEYLDENGHMNIRWYLHIYDDAGAGPHSEAHSLHDVYGERDARHAGVDLRVR